MTVLVASCGGVILSERGGDWNIFDGKEWHEMSKNDAHIIFIDYLGQVMSGEVAAINLELKGK